MLRPDNLGTTRAGLTFLADVRGVDELDRDDQVTILRRTFADVGWQTPRILEALDEAPFYFEALGQARLPVWSRGRVALLGDAAYCASPVSGMSTSLALTGAYVLAGELAAGPDHRAALARYEAVMRPYVEKAQDLPPGAPRIGNPRTRAERALLHTVLRLAASPLGRRIGVLAGGLFTPPADWADLPSYPRPVTAAAHPVPVTAAP
jgi:2-polyprenyl-6-methoxyphenol hydroxylase-like FAD-dependent oxidoreductase